MDKKQNKDKNNVLITWKNTQRIQIQNIYYRFSDKNYKIKINISFLYANEDRICNV